MKTNKDKDYSFQHFSARLKERYKLTITRKQYEDICNNPNIDPLSAEVQDHDTQLIVMMTFKNKEFPAVYSFLGKKFTTVLPMPERKLITIFGTSVEKPPLVTLQLILIHYIKVTLRTLVRTANI